MDCGTETGRTCLSAPAIMMCVLLRAESAVGSLVLDSPAVNKRGLHKLPVRVGLVGVVGVERGDERGAIVVDIRLIVGGPIHDVAAVI